jgi:hypothetical protein
MDGVAYHCPRALGVHSEAGKRLHAAFFLYILDTVGKHFEKTVYSLGFSEK